MMAKWIYTLLDKYITMPPPLNMCMVGIKSLTSSFLNRNRQLKHAPIRAMAHPAMLRDAVFVVQ